MSGPKRMLWLIVPLLMLLGPYAAAQPDVDDPNVRSQRILVERASGELEFVTVYLVRRPDGRVAVVDENGQSYESRDDFLTNNNLFTEDDKILLYNEFPTFEQPTDGELMTVPGKKADYSWIWWTAGCAALVLAFAALVWWKGRSEGVPIFDPEPPR